MFKSRLKTLTKLVERGLEEQAALRDEIRALTERIAGLEARLARPVSRSERDEGRED